MKITVEPTFATKKQIRNLRQANRAIRFNLKKALNYSLDYAENLAKFQYILSGAAARLGPVLGNRLHSRSGRLRASIGHTSARWYADVLSANFGSGIGGKPSVPYANVHEFGFFGSEKVRGHIRLQAHAWGYFGPPFPFNVWVETYSRITSIRARPFIAPALARMESEGLLKRNIFRAIDLGTEGKRFK